MDGLLIIDKPAGWTSHDVVARLRRVLGTRRMGHTGTLDPFATGVLVLLVGKATRLAPFVDKDEKEYEATIRFGFETDTGDVTGTRTVPRGSSGSDLTKTLARTDWESVLSKFRGKIMQTPPMYSAKKIEGKKLYELARRGVEVDRKAVQVSISRLELLPNEFGDPRSTIRIRVVCSAGTYIRTLAEDIGRAVGVGAHLDVLRRTRAGRFTLEDAVTIDHIEKMETPADALGSLNAVVDHLPEIKLSAERAEKTKHGLSTSTAVDSISDGAALRMFDEDSELIAIGIFDAEQKVVKPKIVLV